MTRDPFAELADEIHSYRHRRGATLRDVERTRADCARTARNIATGLALAAACATERQRIADYVRLCSDNAYRAGDTSTGLTLANLQASIEWGRHHAAEVSRG